MGTLIRINTRTKEVKEEQLDAKWALIGGRALTSKIIRQEVPPLAHPLGRQNKLVIAPGILTGTVVANSGRISVGAKSPLTGGIKESNSGGSLSQKLARLGIQGIVLEDKPEDNKGCMVIVVNKDGVKIEDMPELKGKGTYETTEILFKKYGEKVGIMVIGPAGEYLRLGASIQFTDPRNRPARAAGRGGLGAVMGSKCVKAIVVDDAGAKGADVADKEALKEANKRWVEILRSHPVTSQGLPSFGTAVLINIINEAGALPTKNFRYGRFEKAQDVSGEKIAETIEKRGGVVKEGCHPGCVIQCSQAYVDENGNYITSGFEYETVWALGPNTLIDNLDDLAQLDRLCDDLGLDTIEMGNTVAVAMDGGVIPWGDGKAAIELLKRVYDPNDYLGKIIANGSKFTGDALGVERVPVVKNQALPAYDPRSVKGIGVTYATSPMGADHTAGYAVCQNVLKVGGEIDPLKKEGNVEVSKNLQIATAAIDAMGFCLFVAFAVLDTEDAMETIAKLMSAKTGQKVTVDDIINLGVNVLKDEYSFNNDAGFTKAHDQLPEFFINEPLPPHNTTWDFTVEELQQARVL